jgi:hypothetical protein
MEPARESLTRLGTARFFRKVGSRVITALADKEGQRTGAGGGGGGGNRRLPPGVPKRGRGPEPTQGGDMVRKLLFILGTVVTVTLPTGCILNQYSSDPNTRMQQLLHQSEDLRQIEGEWRRFWFNDQPSHLTPERVHGGII